MKIDWEFWGALAQALFEGFAVAWCLGLTLYILAVLL